jgi:flagellar basal-body rod protein FlgC
MSMFQHLNISASALTAQRLRMDLISSNIANATTTRASYVDGEWQPYRRKLAEMIPRSKNQFDNFLEMAMNQGTSSGTDGVRVTRIVEDTSPFKQVYDPSHPDANDQGYVLFPNVDLAKEMVDLMTATRAYEANVTAFNSSKNMAMKALEIGK